MPNLVPKKLTECGIPGEFDEIGKPVLFPENYTQKHFPKLNRLALRFLNLVEHEQYEHLTLSKMARLVGCDRTHLYNIKESPAFIDARARLWGSGGVKLRGYLPAAAKKMAEKAASGNNNALKLLLEMTQQIQPRQGIVINTNIDARQAKISFHKSIQILEAAQTSADADIELIEGQDYEIE